MNQNRESTVVEFGPFRLEPERRLLTNRGTSVPFGDRALDILLVLIEHAPEVVSKKTLFERVWPGIFVVESNLRFQMRKLRKALGDGKDGNRYISTIAGRGYCFVAPLSRSSTSESIVPHVRHEVDEADDAEGVQEPASPETNLLLPLANIIGRDHELAELPEWLKRSRLVTLAGPGGIGKTRLAVELGWHVLRHFPGGVWLVDLAPLRDWDAVANATAAALRVSVTKADVVVETIVVALGKVRRLLIFDNCEHLIEPVAALIKALLERAPHLSVLATGQQNLHVPSEAVYSLGPLEVPPAGASEVGGFAAAELFAARARDADQLFELNGGNGAAIGEICRQLDGLPLALELAAGRLRMLGVEELRKGLNNRLVMLKGARTSDARHASLHAMLEWSHTLLEPFDQRVLRRLGVFPGSFSLDAAIAVATEDGSGRWEIIDAFGRLLDRSLITLGQREPPRYRLLETLRLYAAEKLQTSGEAEAAAERHARHLIELFDEADLSWEATPDPEWLARYQPELGNLQTMLDWALAEPSRRPIALALAASGSLLLHDLFMIAEGRRYLDRILPLLGRDPPPTTAAHILRRAAVFCHASDDPAGQAHAERAAALYRELGDRPNLGRTLCIFVVYHASQGRYAEAKAILLEAQQLLADSRFKKSQLILTNLLGIVSDYMMNPEDARRYFIQAVELAGAVQSVREPMYLSNLGIVEHMSGNIDRAIEVTRAALSRARLSPGHYILGHLLCNLGGYFLLKDNLDEARPLLEEALSLFASRHDYSAIMFLPPLAVLLALEGHPAPAARLIGYVEAERARRKMTAPPDERPLLDKLSTLLSAGLQPVEIEAEKAEGAGWSEAEVIEFTMGRLLPERGPTASTISSLPSASTSPSFS